uniref:Uncharacterized protein n=1 Tax=Anguilla anguilla TaxID=7936 RepID=A0A0E9T1Y9_ANGAN
MGAMQPFSRQELSKLPILYATHYLTFITIKSPLQDHAIKKDNVTQMNVMSCLYK